MPTGKAVAEWMRQPNYHPRMPDQTTESSTYALPSPIFDDAPPTVLAVAFDLDGLMFNTEAVFHRSLTELLARRDKPAPPELFAAMMGLRAVEAHEVMREMMGLTESMETLEEEVGELFRANLDAILQPMPGMLTLLDHLDATSRPKAVCTSSGRAYALDLLTRHDIADRFAFIIGGGDVTRGKPHPEIYETAAERFGIDAASMLVLEDSAHGISAGNAAGAFTVGVPHEFSAGQSYDHAGLVVDSLEDDRLLALLGEK